MPEKTEKPLNYRAFASILTGFSFILMTVTGLVLFFTPSCRIARDTSWSVLGYNKDQWIDVHIWFSIVFVIASIFHIYFNWAVLVCYFKAKVRRGLSLRAEWIVALAACGIIYAGTIYEVPPFSTLMAWKDTFKREGLGAGEHGRGRQGRSRENISESGIIEQQADLHEQQQSQSPHREGNRSRMGQKTLQQFCSEEGIDLTSAVLILKNQGYTVRETMTMREIADSKGVHPSELRNILQPEK